MPTNTFIKASTDLVTNKVMLTTLKFSHPDWDEDLHIIDNTSAITSNGIEYKPYGFRFIPPSSNTSDDIQARIELEDIDRVFSAAFRSINSVAIVEVSVILADNPDVLELGPFTFNVIKVNTAGTILTLNLSRSTVLMNNLTGFTMNIDYFPGLFL